MVTAEKQTSTPLGSQEHRRKHGNQALHRNRFTPELLHRMRPAGERKRVFEGMATGGLSEVHGEVAINGPDRRGGDRKHATLPRRGEAACRARGGGESE